MSNKITGLICLLIVVFISAVSAQTIVKGTVKDTKAKPIPSATVAIKDSSDKIIAYTRSNQEGEYVFTVQAVVAAHFLEVSSLGYARQKTKLIQGQQIYAFALSESTIDLPTVVIDKNPHLRLHGDTLSYQLSDFSEKNDRVLEDVLKKMPGIEVASNGKISYNGKAISNFYIDGDNLLDDKYNIATKSIRKEAIDKVQVIENDQPVKMLRNKTISDDVALNITIKDEAKLKLMGQVNVGAGIPGKFEENSNVMLFNKKYKGINYIKANNIGKDPAMDLISHNLDSYLKRLDNDKPSTFLSTGAAGNPELPQNRYLFNQAALLNANNLLNLKKEVQLKTNIYYLRDKQQRDYSKLTTYTLPSGNISYNEIQDNTSRPEQLHAQTNLTVNRDNFYLSNIFMADYNPVKYRVGLSSNEVSSTQRLNQQQFDISNEFNLMNTLKSGKVVNFYSYLNVIRQPEKLSVYPGINAEQFNDGLPYATLQQSVTTSSFFTNNYWSAQHHIGALTHTYKMGFSLQEQHLESGLTAIQSDQTANPALPNSANDLSWNRRTAYAEVKSEYLGEKLKTNLTLPLKYQHIGYEDPGFALDQKSGQLIFNPKASVKLQTSIENYLLLSLSRNTTFGDLDEIYRGSILRNYRSLFSNDAPLSRQTNNSAALGFNYRKAITLFFYSLQLSYGKISMNTISSSLINNNLQQRIVLPFDNNTDTYSLRGNISKYLFNLKSTISAGLSYSQQSANQIQNEQLLRYSSRNGGLKLGLQSKLTSWMSMDYTFDYNQYSNKTTDGSTGNIRYNKLNHRGVLAINMLQNIMINASADHIYTKQTGQEKLSYVFADLSVRYRVEKIKADFEFAITNFTDVKTYKDVYLTTNIFTSATYQIPGRITMLKATFNF